MNFINPRYSLFLWKGSGTITEVDIDRLVTDKLITIHDLLSAAPQTAAHTQEISDTVINLVNLCDPRGYHPRAQVANIGSQEQMQHNGVFRSLASMYLPYK